MPGELEQIRAERRAVSLSFHTSAQVGLILVRALEMLSMFLVMMHRLVRWQP